MSRPGTWRAGQSGNPGGRSKIASIIKEATGKSASEVSAEMFKLLYEAAHSCDPHSKDEAPSFRFAVGEILDRIHGKAKETVAIEESPADNDEQYRQALRDITRDELAKMSEEERYAFVAQIGQPQ